MKQTKLINFPVIFLSQWTYFYIILFWIYILFPSCVEASEFLLGQERFKNYFGFFIDDFNIPSPLLISCTKGFNVSSEIEYFIYESGTKSSSRLVKFCDSNIFFDSINSQTMFNKKPDKITNNTTRKRESKIFYIFQELIHRPPFMFALGSIVTSLILGFAYIFTHTTKKSPGA